MSKEQLMELLRSTNDMFDATLIELQNTSPMSPRYITLTNTLNGCKGAIAAISVVLDVLTPEQLQNYVSGQEWR